MTGKLHKLSNREGVKAALVLDRTSGAVLATIGDFSSLLAVSSNGDRTDANISGGSGITSNYDSNLKDINSDTHTESTPSSAANVSDGERFAGTIWQFLVVSGTMLERIDPDVSYPS